MSPTGGPGSPGLSRAPARRRQGRPDSRLATALGLGLDGRPAAVRTIGRWTAARTCPNNLFAGRPISIWCFSLKNRGAMSYLAASCDEREQPSAELWNTHFVRVGKGRTSRIGGACVALLVLSASLGACSSDASPPSSAASGSSATSSSADSTSPASSVAPDGAAPSIDGRFKVTGERSLALKCWGKGTPTVVFDAGTGDPGIARVEGTSYVDVLAKQSRVCAYDRAGLGNSDPAPLRKRVSDDVAGDLHGLLESAEVAPPYVLVGSSGGGGYVYQYAGRYPADVVGLVMLDVPVGRANISPSEVPAVDSPENPEHMDYVAVEREMALHRLPIRAIPVTVVTASRGQSPDPKEQRVWLRGSSRPVQVILDGTHDIFSDDPSGVVAQIQKVLAATRPR